VGETKPDVGVSDAAGGRPAGRLVKRLAVALAKDRSGATAIEYGLIISLIFLVIVTSLNAFASNATTVIDTAANAISGRI
jgi:pilus assembly protein Flp/PilA